MDVLALRAPGSTPRVAALGMPEHLQSRLLVLEQPHPYRPLLVVDAGGLGQRAIGDDPGVRFDRDMRLEPVLAAVHGLVRVPRFGIDS
jgi:hypothetical protein